jgi:hypothetical protein
MRFWRRDPPATIGVASTPTLVGALGGSGTRVVARLLRRAGLYMGSDLNEAEDSEPVMGFYDVWLRRYLERDGALGDEAAVAQRDLDRALGRHLAGLRDRSRAWGVKVPRSILMLRFWHDVFPELRFVHVVRSGLDMAYSDDRNQLWMVGDLLLESEERALDEPERAMAYWQRVNLQAADYGEQHLAQRYLRLRFEDVCARPLEAFARLCELVGSRPGTASGVEEVVVPPSSLGRWRGRPAAEVERLREIGALGLRRFGYATA